MTNVICSECPYLACGLARAYLKIFSLTIILKLPCQLGLVGEMSHDGYEYYIPISWKLSYL